MTAHAHTEPAGSHAAHAGPHRNYVKIWALLVVLLMISVFGPFLGIRLVTLLTAFGVAVVKAYLVAKNFMHLDVEKPIIHWMMAIAVVFMALLFAGVSPDVMKHEGLRWEKPSRPVPAAQAGHAGGQGGSEQNGSSDSHGDSHGGH
jgi:caa(3)-type oxidase subunit IV